MEGDPGNGPHRCGDTPPARPAVDARDARPRCRAGVCSRKAGRGLRHIKRAVRGDLHCLKAFIDMQEVESGAWRGRIEDRAIVKEHDPEYDGSREYSDPKATLGEPDEDEATDDRDRDPQDEESRAGRRRAGKGSQAPGRSASGPSSGGGQQSSSRSASSGSRRASGRSGQHPRSASRASGRSSGTKTRGRQATARKNS